MIVFFGFASWGAAFEEQYSRSQRTLSIREDFSPKWSSIGARFNVDDMRGGRLGEVTS